jgi:hypothetical protein
VLSSAQELPVNGITTKDNGFATPNALFDAKEGDCFDAGASMSSRTFVIEGGEAQEELYGDDLGAAFEELRHAKRLLSYLRVADSSTRGSLGAPMSRFQLSASVVVVGFEGDMMRSSNETKRLCCESCRLKSSAKSTMHQKKLAPTTSKLF